MMLPSIVRIFFALEIQTATKERLGEFITVLKKSAKSHAIRWTVPENLHITLQFLAEMDSTHLPLLIENVRASIVGTVQKTEVNFGTIQLFPNPFRPRVIVLDITPQEPLAILADLIGRGIQATEYTIETRTFRGHLTLGRIKHTHGVNLNFLSHVTLPKLLPIEVKEVVLFRSEPIDHGSKYTVLERIQLNEDECKTKTA